jgi:hypothetical protein
VCSCVTREFDGTYRSRGAASWRIIEGLGAAAVVSESETMGLDSRRRLIEPTGPLRGAAIWGRLIDGPAGRLSSAAPAKVWHFYIALGRTCLGRRRGQSIAGQAPRTCAWRLPVPRRVRAANDGQDEGGRPGGRRPACSINCLPMFRVALAGPLETAINQRAAGKHARAGGGGPC